MPLSLETFSNARGGNCFFKAIAHPLAAEKATALLDTLRQNGEVAIYDPLNRAAAFNEVYDLASLPLAGYFIQDVERQDCALAGCRASPVTEIGNVRARQLLITAFDADKFRNDIRHLVPHGMAIASLDGLRLPEFMQTERRNYLSLVNFATNFAFFREGSRPPTIGAAMARERLHSGAGCTTVTARSWPNGRKSSARPKAPSSSTVG
jgi:hypothetical protein